MGITPEECILIIDDNPQTVGLLEEGLRTVGISNPIISLETGDDALDYLFRREAYADPASAPRPGMILLDLNMPGTDGREVLAEIKQNEELRVIPVIVLSTSFDERDIQVCYAHGANSYIPKPVDRDGLVKAMGRLQNYWFEVVALPQPQIALTGS